MYKCFKRLLRLWGRRLIFNIIFGGMIIALANKSIITHDITLSSVSSRVHNYELLVSVMISSPDNY